MRTLFLVLMALAITLPATAQSRHAEKRRQPPAAHRVSAAPKEIGRFEDWTAATHAEAGQTVCYAFTRPSQSSPAVPGRGEVVLTVTERPGGIRDSVAISAGFAYAPNAAVTMQVDETSLPFYTSQRSAFARDGHSVVQAFERGRQAMAKSPGPRGVSVADTFPLRGFSAAYQAINKACPSHR